jgi:hypothetical protein
MNDRKSLDIANSISLLLPSTQQKRAAAETWDRKRRERRCAAINASLDKNPKITRPEDRRIVATNLGEILDRLESGGRGKKVAVLRAANMGEDGNSTKQLYNYTLPRSPTMSSTLEKRLSKLVKRVDGYVKLAQTAADLAAWDEREILIDLFRGSTYDAEASGPVPDLPDYLFALDEILDRLKSWLVKQTDIQWYYETLRKYPVWDEWGNFDVGCPILPPPDNSGGSSIFYGKAIPGITLFRFLCSELPVEFVSKEKFDPDSWNSDDEPPPEAHIEQLTFRHYFDVRLGLAPVGKSGNIRFVFDQRRVSELWQVQEAANPDEGTEAIETWRAYAPISFRPRSSFRKRAGRGVSAGWSPSDFYGAFDPRPTIVERDSYDEIGLFGGWIRFTSLDTDSVPPNEMFENIADSNASEDDDLLRSFQDQFIEEVEPSTCKKYLDMEINDHIQCKWTLLPIPLECPANTIAARIESALYSDDAENRLETTLQKAIADRCSLLNICIERRNGSIAERKEKLFSRWEHNETKQ